MASPRAMQLFTSAIDEPDLLDFIKNIGENATSQVGDIVKFAGRDMLIFLRSYTDIYRPPRYQRAFRLDAHSRRIAVLPTDTSEFRPAHPGGWADISDDLMNRYYAQALFVAGAWELVIGNRSEHAVFVEAMDGYFVIHGIFDAGGPVSRSIRRAIIALGFKDWVVDPMSANTYGWHPAPQGTSGLRVSLKTGGAAEPPTAGGEP